MIGELVNTGAVKVQLLQNFYDGAGDDVQLKYRTGATSGACEAAAWSDYTDLFDSAGFVQVRVDSTL